MTGRGRPAKVGDCGYWLTAYLSGGKRPVGDILRAGLRQVPPYRERTLRAFKAKLGIKHSRDDFGRGSTCYWYDPSVPEEKKPENDGTTRAALLQAIYELKRDTRLSKPPVPKSGDDDKSGDEYIPTHLGRGTPINWDDPNDPGARRVMQQADAHKKRTEARNKEIHDAIYLPQPLPFNYLDNLVDAGEVEEMASAAHAHIARLEERQKAGEDLRKELECWQSWLLCAKDRKNVLAPVLEPEPERAETDTKTTTKIDTEIDTKPATFNAVHAVSGVKG